MNEIKNDERTIEHLKRIFENLDRYWKSIELLLSHVSQPLVVDDRGLASALKYLTEQTKINIEMVKGLDITQCFNEIKYIGNRLNNIETDIAEIKNKGVNHKVGVELSLDGFKYEPKLRELPAEIDPLDQLLGTLLEREAQVLVYRLGLKKDAAPLTFVEIGKNLGISAGRVGQIYNKAIRKIKHPSRIKITEKINNPRLKKALE